MPFLIEERGKDHDQGSLLVTHGKRRILLLPEAPWAGTKAGGKEGTVKTRPRAKARPCGHLRRSQADRRRLMTQGVEALPEFILFFVARRVGLESIDVKDVHGGAKPFFADTLGKHCGLM